MEIISEEKNDSSGRVNRTTTKKKKKKKRKRRRNDGSRGYERRRKGKGPNITIHMYCKASEKAEGARRDWVRLRQKKDTEKGRRR